MVEEDDSNTDHIVADDPPASEPPIGSVDVPPPAAAADGTGASMMVSSLQSKVSSLLNDPRTRQYIRDRSNGRSRYHPENRPPCRACWVPPCVYYCSDCLEQNALCERNGKLGLVDHDEPKIRRKVFTVGLVGNAISLVLTLFACFSVSKDFNMLRAASFTKGSAQVQQTGNVLHMDIGLRGVAVADELGRVKPQVISFGQFCDGYLSSLGNYTVPGQCNECQKEASGLTTTVIFSLLTILPSITTDVLRMYPNYDVNCQKFYGSIVAAISMFLSLYTFMIYNRKCIGSFYDGDSTPFQVYNYTGGPGEAVPNRTSIGGGTYVQALQPTTMAALAERADDPSILSVKLDWKSGAGLICLYVATFLKIFDILANLVVPTPSITRDKEEQRAYEDKYGKNGNVSEEAAPADEGGDGGEDGAGEEAEE